MQFLGTIGIDPKLLLAQIINFIILLWLLNKFLYKPLISQIEKEEKTLHDAQKEKEELTKEKEEEQTEKNNQISQLQKKSQTILSEAEEMSTKIKEDAVKKAREEASVMIAETKKRLEEQQTRATKSVENLKEHELSDRLTLKLRQNLSMPAKRAMSQAFFHLVLEDAKDLEIPHSALSRNQTLKAVVETSYVLPESEIEALKEILMKKTKGKSLDISTKINADLIGGVRLQFAGKIIEEGIVNYI